MKHHSKKKKTYIVKTAIQLEITVPDCSPVCGPGQNRRQEVFHWEPSCLCRELDIMKIYIEFTTGTAFADCAN